VSFVVILVAFLKASELSSFPCRYLWLLWCFYGWSSSIYNKINWAFGHTLKAKISLVYCMTLLWISCSILSINFMCTCVFMIIIFVILSTSKLIHMRDGISLFDILYDLCLLGRNATQYHSLKTMWMLYAHPCISLIICFIIFLIYSFDWAFCYVVSYLLLNHFFDASVKLNLFSMISLYMVVF
jgi:hypothetical protein